VQNQGVSFQQMADASQQLTQTTLSSPDGPLSAGLANAHNNAAQNAANFKQQKDAGLSAAGNMLSQFGGSVANLDQQNGAQIRQVSRTV
jgi:hypothetical protein